ncbi:GPI-anchor transamidase, putative [Plasmodium vinckei]|uniref:GPI-anchor transamidase, putative n=1 Tax=Plasmodium vinckei TaxID=5860 RepID=A0A6V7SXP1_PLAVN|nr:GPI-anchor transamidase, putative [Plasmodium vinckei]
MELKIGIVIYLLVAIKCVIGSIYFSGVDIKNIKSKYDEIKNSNNKKYINEIILKEFKKNNYINSNVIALSTSRHYFNYRHTANLLIAYKYLKNNGDIMDKNILLMLPFDQACNCRNIIEGTIFKNYEKFPNEYLNKNMEKNLYNKLNIDYKNDNINDDQLRKVIRHRYNSFTPSKNRLYTNEYNEKNLFIYITGHGGVNFLKIQEFNILSSSEFNLYIQELLIKNIYKYIFVVIDTCQGYSFYDDILSFINQNKIKNVFLLSSSDRNENSYSFFSSKYLSVSTVDRFTYNFFDYMENIHQMQSKEIYKNLKLFSLQNILNYLKTKNLMSHPSINNSKFNVSSFLHDQNVIFYDSSMLFPKIFFSKLNNNTNDPNNNHDNIHSEHTCFGYLGICDHIKSQIYLNMESLYHDRSYYSNDDVHNNYEFYFTDICSNFKYFDIYYMAIFLILLFFILLFLILFVLN